MCEMVNYLKKKSKSNVTNSGLQAIQEAEHFRAKYDKWGGGFTFLYSVSSSAFMPCSWAGAGGLVGNGLMGFGRARILPSSPNHFLSWGPSRGKDIFF